VARYDEDDVRVRPRPGSRPRTRTRPAHLDAVNGIVTAVDRGRWTVLPDHQRLSVTAMRGSELRRTPVVVGDVVSLVGDVSGATDALARIVRVADRRSLLRRSADDQDPIERPVVANADLLVCVVALADPPPRVGLIDRVLVAAYDGGLSPVICLTKADLAPDTISELYAPMGVPTVVCSRDLPTEPLLGLLRGKTSVFFGHSGVGKSTLVNRLVPDAFRAVGAVNDVTGRGRHTSSSAVLFELPDGAGRVIDTPGIRGFGLGAVSVTRVLNAFPDLAEGADGCPPGCLHGTDSPGCALDAWVTDGHASPERLTSLRRLLVSRGADDPRNAEDPSSWEGER
jgi:ribosome biogenesis GTPase